MGEGFGFWFLVGPRLTFSWFLVRLSDLGFDIFLGILPLVWFPKVGFVKLALAHRLGRLLLRLA